MGARTARAPARRGDTRTALTQVGALTSFIKLVDAAMHLDAEFVLALGDADPSPLGELPDNARVAGWVPLSALLPTCVVLVHHGGAGLTLTAIDGWSHATRAAARRRPVHERGRGGAAWVGLRSEPDQVDAELIDRPPTDPGVVWMPLEVADEIAMLPQARRPRAENRRPRLTSPGVHTVACTNPLG